MRETSARSTHNGHGINLALYSDHQCGTNVNQVRNLGRNSNGMSMNRKAIRPVPLYSSHHNLMSQTLPHYCIHSWAVSPSWRW